MFGLSAITVYMWNLETNHLPGALYITNAVPLWRETGDDVRYGTFSV